MFLEKKQQQQQQQFQTKLKTNTNTNTIKKFMIIYNMILRKYTNWIIHSKTFVRFTILVYNKEYRKNVKISPSPFSECDVMMRSSSYTRISIRILAYNSDHTVGKNNQYKNDCHAINILVNMCSVTNIYRA